MDRGFAPGELGAGPASIGLGRDWVDIIGRPTHILCFLPAELPNPLTGESAMQIRKIRFAASGAIALALIPAAALAHHGWSSYDPNTVLKITGPVESSSYTYPHTAITLAHEGNVWEIVLAPPSRMTNRGLSAEHIQVGQVVTVEGYPSRAVAHELRAERITIDGTVTELR